MPTAHPNIGSLVAGFKLTATTSTVVFTVGNDTENIEVNWIRIADSTGAVATPVTVKIVLPDGVEYVVGFQMVVDANDPLVLDLARLRMYRGGTISVQGGAGHHVIISYVPLSSGGSVQR
jgi:hypothetical protein